MKTSLRAWFYLLSVMVVVVALVSLPAAAQEAPPAAPSVAAASSSSTAPAPYNPAAAAFATPKPAAAAASSEGPDPDRRWEVEIHGGYQFAINPTSGTSNLPNPGAPFLTIIASPTRAVSSWYFGDGALLYSQWVDALNALVGPPNVLNDKITPWDPVLTSSVVRRQDGGTVGGRVSYDFNRRINAELNFDYNMGDLAFTSGSLINTQATSDSFLAAWTENLTTCGACTILSITSTPTLVNHQGAAFEFTGGVNVNFWTSGRFIPYASVGVGVLHTTGDVPAINLTGNYDYIFGAQEHNETDSATLITSVQGNTFVGYVGVGAKYYVTPHWGFRFDVRDHISANGISNLLSAS
ncbi:MAG TPA: outer membrane beta-barrel protein, partial [Terriglobales bacterium]|nr:outer membrane beta-barrel protein [Terriglobales bacterium]